MRWFGKGFSKAAPAQTVPCPHCGASVAENAAVCRACGYDWDEYREQPEDSGEDDFDYDEFVESEFGDRRLSKTLAPWQRAVVVLLIVAFAATLLWPILFR